MPGFAEAAKLQPGVHEIAVVLWAGLVKLSGQPVFSTDSSSRIEIINRDSGMVLGTAALRSQEVSVDTRQVIRWTIDVDADGRVRAQ